MSNFDPFAAEWISYAKSPQYTLVEKCLKLSQILEFPNLDISEYIQKLEIIGAGVTRSCFRCEKSNLFGFYVKRIHV